jgi:hypothetical protein
MGVRLPPRPRGDFLSWDGETSIKPPPTARHDQLRLDDARPRPVWPDAVLDISGDSGQAGTRLLLIEYDRTRPVDKNYEKFRRYDAFFTWWWRHSDIVYRDGRPSCCSSARASTARSS